MRTYEPLKVEIYRIIYQAMHDAVETKATRPERRWITQKATNDIVEKVRFLFEMPEPTPEPPKAS